MTLKFAKHNNKCWHVFSLEDDFVEITNDGVKALGEIVDMDDPDGLDGSIGHIVFLNDVPVWTSNILGLINCGTAENLTATELRELADFMETLRVPQNSKLARFGLTEEEKKILEDIGFDSFEDVKPHH